MSFTVALIGPDGVGKTTIARRMADALPFASRYIYMGVNLESSNLVLPTTRLALEVKRLLGRRPDMSGPPDPTRRRTPRGPFRRMLKSLKSAARLANQLLEEGFRQLIIRWHLLRGRVVVLDRDFYADYHAHDVAGGASLPLSSRIHGFALRNFYRRPDLIICLDADPETMFRRKGEGTLELLERRRREYLELRSSVRHFELVDATRPLEEVAQDVRRRVCRHHAQLRASKKKTRNAQAS